MDSIEITLDSLRNVGFSELEEDMFIITDEPKLPGYLCFPKKGLEDRFNTNEVYGQGIDTHSTIARVKCVGEFLERLCLDNPQKDRFVYSGFDDRDVFVDPGLFSCYSEEQLPDREEVIEQSRKEKYLWWKAKDFFSGKDMLIPGQLIFLSNDFNDEFPIRRESISTGAALGKIGEDRAFKSGFLEVVERDAAMSAYLNRRKIKKITNLPDSLNNLNEYIKRYQLDTNLFDITTDLGIPSILAVTLDHSGVGDAVNVGSNSAIDYETAIKYALLESIQCRRQSRVSNKFGFEDKIPKEDEIVSMDDRFAYWRDISRINDLDFWVKSDDSISFDELKERKVSLNGTIRSMKDRGFHIYVADLTLPKIRAHGFEVKKVVIPELHPLYLDERAKALYSVHHGRINDDPTLKPHPIT
jgi:thiazole/oxazole-forming peptide maturase SagD family component|tara:strand:+ start:20830 stop:22068 length:1239 start_codon:yes stop_codon:yes gene_type:complete